MKTRNIENRRYSSKKYTVCGHFSPESLQAVAVKWLSVVLWPEEGDFPKSLHRAVYVTMNKRSLESFMCLVQHSYSSLDTT